MKFGKSSEERRVKYFYFHFQCPVLRKRVLLVTSKETESATDRAFKRQSKHETKESKAIP
jgi:hypothetical protein